MTYAGKTTRRAAIVAALFGSLAVSTPLQLYAQDVEEIIVTARKRNESIQEVPVAVTAITANMVEQMGLQDLDDIAKLTAGMIFDPEFNRNSNRPVIRGQANILNDSGVSYFIDGVYITGSINDYDINDIERIEVVKGPQSALYGRNTYSGAINIYTKSPTEEWTVRGQVKATDDSQQEISATVKGPITDSLSVGITGRFYESDGFWTNAYDGTDIGEQESTSFSGVALFEPSDRFKARARVYWNETRDGQPALFAQPASENNCFPDTGSSLYAGLGRYYCGVIQPRAIMSDWREQAPDARDDYDTLQASLSMEFGLTDDLTLTSITGFNDVDETFITEADYDAGSFAVANFTPNGFPFAGFPVPPFDYGYVGSMIDFTFASQTDTDDISQELRLSWSGDGSEYLLGAYYFDQDRISWSIRDLPADGQARATANYFAEFGRMQGVCAANPICGSMTPFFGPTVGVSRNVTEGNIKNTAVFGMASFDLSDATGLTIEGRYAEEEVEQVAVLRQLGGPVIDVVPASATFDSFSPRITVDHQLSDDHMIYALYAEGTKPGGFNNSTAILAGLPSFEEEEVDSIEVGSKSTGLDGQLVANFAIYFNQVDGYQLTQNARAGANTTSATVNAGDADIFGAEFEFQYAPASIEGLSFMLNYAYTDAEFVEGFDENLGLLLDVADDGAANCSTGNQFPDPNDPTACTSAFGSIDGKQIPRTAEHQFFFDAELRRPMGNGEWEWFVGANYSHESSKFGQVANFAETGEADLVSARLGFNSDRYQVSLWGKNLTGEDSTPLVLRYADGNDSFKRNFVGTQRRDTYWGLTASATF
ncbi:MAG: TonB-dependent receptor [Woeseiaceae bacterium]